MQHADGAGSAVVKRSGEPGFRGRGDAALSPAALRLFADDPHRPGSVDAVLLEQRVQLTPATHPSLYAPPVGPVAYQRGSRPALEAIAASALGNAFHEVQKAVALTRFCCRIPRTGSDPQLFTGNGDLGDAAEHEWGGTEEELVAGGCPLAAEGARLLCALAQVAGLHARMVFLASVDPPERHTVTELFVGGRWSLFDGWSGRFYPWSKHGYASAWDIRQMPSLIDNHPDHGRQRYVDSRYFQYVAIAFYDIAHAAEYRYHRDPIPPTLADRLREGFGG